MGDELHSFREISVCPHHPRHPWSSRVMPKKIAFHVYSIALLLYCSNSAVAADQTEESQSGQTTVLSKSDSQTERPLLLDTSQKYQHFLQICGAYYFPNHWGYRSKGFAPVNYSRREYSDIEREYPAIEQDPAGARNDMGLPFQTEIKAFYTFQMTFPAMRGDHFLVRENSIKLKLKANLSPVTVEAGPYLEINPVAFLVFEIGSRLGTGWDFDLFNVNGLAVNDKNFRYSKKQTRFERTPGLVSFTDARARFQFDTAALITNRNTDWLHFVFAADETVFYQYFSGAKNSQYWRWEHDIGENQNGFVWNQVLFLGYQMPRRPGFLDLTGILVETEQRITGKNKSKMKDGGWGSDFISCEFGPLFSFQFTEAYRLTFIAQFKTARQYTDDSVGYRYFENRNVNTKVPTYIYFNRVALVFDATF